MKQIIFRFDTDYGPLVDALHLEDDHGLTEEQIEALKIERRDAWLEVCMAAEQVGTVSDSIVAEQPGTVSDSE